jgi:hypothetical protein
MKLKIKTDCRYLNKKYKKGEEVTVNKRVGEILTTFRYATEIKKEQKEEKTPDLSEEELKKVPEKEKSKQSGDK